MNRRTFLKGIAGITAAGILLPGEEQVKRFWRGWSPDSLAATAPQLTIGDYELASPFAHLTKGEIVFLLDDRATGKGQFAWWTGNRFVPQVPAFTGKLTPFPDSPRSPLQLHQPDSGFPGPHGFPVVDFTDYHIDVPVAPPEPTPFVTTQFALGIGDDGMRLINRGVR